VKQNSLIAGILSLIIPGLGHIYSGERNKGAVILAAAIIIGNMNIIFLLIFTMANPSPDIP
jgi:hypothetical protein